jgi:hypothetical protein
MNSLAIFDTFQLLAEMACVAQQNGYLLWMLACCQEHNWPVLDTTWLKINTVVDVIFDLTDV